MLPTNSYLLPNPKTVEVLNRSLRKINALDGSSQTLEYLQLQAKKLAKLSTAQHVELIKYFAYRSAKDSNLLKLSEKASSISLGSETFIRKVMRNSGTVLLQERFAKAFSILLQQVSVDDLKQCIVQKLVMGIINLDQSWLKTVDNAFLYRMMTSQVGGLRFQAATWLSRRRYGANIPLMSDWASLCSLSEKYGAVPQTGFALVACVGMFHARDANKADYAFKSAISSALKFIQFEDAEKHWSDIFRTWRAVLAFDDYNQFKKIALGAVSLHPRVHTWLKKELAKN